MFVNDPARAAEHHRNQLLREATLGSAVRDAGASRFGDLAFLGRIASRLAIGFRARGQQAAQRARRAVEEWVRERQDFPTDARRRA